MLGTSFKLTNGSWAYRGGMYMVQNAIIHFFITFTTFVVDVAFSFVRFVVVFFGPVVTACLVAAAAALWYIGWI